MRELQKTAKAEQDLISIWNYTADKWDIAQADKYLHKIDACFQKICAGKAILRTITGR